MIAALLTSLLLVPCSLETADGSKVIMRQGQIVYTFSAAVDEVRSLRCWVNGHITFRVVR